MARCEVKSVGNEFVITGTVDETFGEVNGVIPPNGTVNINLKDLKSINSTGIREWIKLMQKMKTAQIYLFNCPKVFIDQVNIVKGFIPTNAQIKSFFVPYYNEKNDTEKVVLFTHGTHYTEGQLNPLPAVVDELGAPMEPDVVEAKYFKFIKG